MTIRVDGSERLEDGSMILQENWGNTGGPRVKYTFHKRGRQWWLRRSILWIWDKRQIEEPSEIVTKEYMAHAMKLRGPVDGWLREVHGVKAQDLANYR